MTVEITVGARRITVEITVKNTVEITVKNTVEITVKITVEITVKNYGGNYGSNYGQKLRETAAVENCMCV